MMSPEVCNVVENFIVQSNEIMYPSLEMEFVMTNGHHQIKQFQKMRYVILIFWSMLGSCSPDELEFCSSEKCNEKARFMYNAMNHSIHPCENFYQYSCGNFMKRKEDIYKSFWDLALHRWSNILAHNVASESNPKSPVENFFFNNVVKCNSGTKADCLVRWIASSPLGIIVNIRIISDNSQSIYQDDAERVVKELLSSFRSRTDPWNLGANHWIHMVNNTRIILISKKTLPTLKSLSQLLKIYTSPNLEQFIKDDENRPRWLKSGFLDFLDIIRDRKIAFMGKSAGSF